MSYYGPSFAYNTPIGRPFRQPFPGGYGVGQPQPQNYSYGAPQSRPSTRHATTTLKTQSCCNGVLDAAQPSISLTTRLLKNLPWAALTFTSGMLLNRLPTYIRPGMNLLPADWKVYAKVILGILTVSQLNKATGWKPPPWLAGIEAASIIHPLTSGISLQSLKQLVILAPMVGTVVQAANSLNQAVGKKLEDNFNIPRCVTRLAVSAGMILLGLKVFPSVFQSFTRSGFLSKTVSHPASGEAGALLANTITCARGCTPGGIVCMSELGELLGGLGHWFKNTPSKSQKEPIAS